MEHTIKVAHINGATEHARPDIARLNNAAPD